MRIDLRKLISGEIKKMPIEYSFPIDEAPEPDQGLETIDTRIDGVAFESPVRVKGEIVNMGGYMRLTAVAAIDYNAECARCLLPLERSFEVSVERTIVSQGTLENTPDDEADEYLVMSENAVDPDQLFIEELMMEFPTRELCDENCKGLCPKCGKNLNDGDCGCVKKEIDPRLAILQKLLEKE